MLIQLALFAQDEIKLLRNLQALIGVLTFIMKISKIMPLPM